MRSLQISGWVQQSLLLTNGAASTTHRITENLNWITSRKPIEIRDNPHLLGWIWWKLGGDITIYDGRFPLVNHDNQASYSLHLHDSLTFGTCQEFTCHPKWSQEPSPPDFQSQFKRHPMKTRHFRRGITREMQSKNWAPMSRRERQFLSSSLLCPPPTTQLSEVDNASRKKEIVWLDYCWVFCSFSFSCSQFC